jgi:hypothetical protein
MCSTQLFTPHTTAYPGAVRTSASSITESAARPALCDCLNAHVVLDCTNPALMLTRQLFARYAASLCRGDHAAVSGSACSGADAAEAVLGAAAAAGARAPVCGALSSGGRRRRQHRHPLRAHSSRCSTQRRGLPRAAPLGSSRVLHDYCCRVLCRGCSSPFFLFRASVLSWLMRLPWHVLQHRCCGCPTRRTRC